MTEQQPTDEQIRAYLDRNPTAFRDLITRSARHDPAWWDRIRRRHAALERHRDEGRPYP